MEINYHHTAFSWCGFGARYGAVPPAMAGNSMATASDWLCLVVGLFYYAKKKEYVWPSLLLSFCVRTKRKCDENIRIYWILSLSILWPFTGNVLKWQRRWLNEVRRVGREHGRTVSISSFQLSTDKTSVGVTDGDEGQRCVLFRSFAIMKLGHGP